MKSIDSTYKLVKQLLSHVLNVGGRKQSNDVPDQHVHELSRNKWMLFKPSCATTFILLPLMNSDAPSSTYSSAISFVVVKISKLYRVLQQMNWRWRAQIVGAKISYLYAPPFQLNYNTQYKIFLLIILY